MSEKGSPEYEQYIEYRKYVLERHLESSRSFDRAMYTLAGGALFISLSFVGDVVPHPEYPLLLALAWASFGFSLLWNLLSTYAAERDYFKSIGKVDAAYEDGSFPQIEMTGFEKWVPRLNHWGLWSFVGGLALLIAFAALNLKGG